MPEELKHRQPWSLEDDAVLVDRLRRSPSTTFTWQELAVRFGRTAAACQARYWSLVKVGKAPAVSELEHHVSHVSHFSDGYAYALRVPESDPLLARLQKYHGQDKVDRNVRDFGSRP